MTATPAWDAAGGTVALPAAGVALLAGGWVVAVRDPVPPWEVAATVGLSGLPAAVAWTLWPLMQAGTFGGPVVVAAALIARDRRNGATALAVLLGGEGAWFAAKAVKEVVRRGRPLAYDSAVTVREGDGSGLGFTSGHAAVAFAIAAALWPTCGARGRAALVGAASLVGIARVVHGVHLPIDVVGGAGLGLLCGSAARAVVGRGGRRSAVRPATWSDRRHL